MRDRYGQSCTQDTEDSYSEYITTIKPKILLYKVELPNVESENINLVIHENSVYLKAFSKTVEFWDLFSGMGR
jgi:hypothetical protein